MKITKRELNILIKNIINEAYSFDGSDNLIWDNSSDDSIDVDSATPYFHSTNEANVDLDEDNEEVSFTFFTADGSEITLDEIPWDEMPDTLNGDEYLFLVQKLADNNIILPHDATQEVFTKHDYQYLQEAYEDYSTELEEMQSYNPRLDGDFGY